MKRRTLILGAIATAAGASAFVSYRLGQHQQKQPPDLLRLTQNNPRVNFGHLSPDIWAKLINGALTDADRHALERELIRHNDALYAGTAVGRRPNKPGFFGIETSSK